MFIQVLIDLLSCIAGLGDHRFGPHQAGPLPGLANEQGPTWRLPQEEKATIDRGHRVIGQNVLQNVRAEI